jgi:hypothetical protein
MLREQNLGGYYGMAAGGPDYSKLWIHYTAVEVTLGDTFGDVIKWFRFTMKMLVIQTILTKFGDRRRIIDNQLGSCYRFTLVGRKDTDSSGVAIKRPCCLSC